MVKRDDSGTATVLIASETVATVPSAVGVIVKMAEVVVALLHTDVKIVPPATTMLSTLLAAVTVLKPVPETVSEKILLGHNDKAMVPSPVLHLSEEVTPLMLGPNKILKVPFTLRVETFN